MSVSRRDFMKASLGSMAYFTTASSVPFWISKSAEAVSSQLPNDRILVIVQLAGGNDGLNTVIPYTDSLYNGDTLRPNLHITSGLGPTTIDSFNAFHPQLIRMKDWFDNGNVAVIQNVGYPNPDLSHFIATDYWEQGTSPSSALQSKKGWLARYVDNECEGVPPENIDALTMLGAGQFLVPTTLNGSELYTPPAVFDTQFYNILVPNEGDLKPFGDHVRDYIMQLSNNAVINPATDFVQRAANVAQASVEDIQVAAAQAEINAYPQGSLGNGLDLASKVIRAGFGTRVFYVSQGGYDTHANQFANNDPANLGDHPRLLATLDEALHAFLSDMDASGNLDRVVVMTFTEFGRRVDENGSFGTDHGAGNSLFVMGGPIEGRVYGGQPNLSDLRSGNLRHLIDFRSVYSRILQDWFEVDPEAIFGSADYNDPVLDIQGGLEQIPIFGGTGSLYGDANGDGVVNSQDVQTVVNTAIGMDSSAASDINTDGVTNAVDIQLAINEVLRR